MNVKIGDLIYVERPLPIPVVEAVLDLPVVEKLPINPVPGMGSHYKHYGIYCGYYEDGACHFVFDFDGQGPHVKPWEQFSQGREVRISDRNESLSGDASAVMERIYHILSLSPEDCQKFLEYNLLSNNCEHVALWCKTGNAVSYQVNKVKRETGNLAIREVTRHGPKVINRLIRELLRG